MGPFVAVPLWAVHIADGIVKADGAVVYAATDLRVGLIAPGEPVAAA